MESKQFRKALFLSQSQYSSIVNKSRENLYFVEFQPNFNFFPNYSSGISISANTTYTVGSGALANYSAGWFRIGFTGSSWHGQSPQLVIHINGQAFYASYGCAFTMSYLTTGDTFSSNSAASNVNSRFFPVITK